MAPPNRPFPPSLRALFALPLLQSPRDGCPQPPLLDVLVVGEDDDGPGVGRLQQLPDDFIEVDALVPAVLGDLQGLGDAEPTCAREQRTKGPSEEGRKRQGRARDRQWGMHSPRGSLAGEELSHGITALPGTPWPASRGIRAIPSLIPTACMAGEGQGLHRLCPTHGREAK